MDSFSPDSFSWINEENLVNHLVLCQWRSDFTNLSPILFLSERITKKTKIKTKTISKKKRQFLSQLQNLFGFLEGLWTPSLLCLNLCMVCILCDVCVDVVVGWEKKKTKKNEKEFDGFYFQVLFFCTQQNTTTKLCLTLQGIWYCYCFYVVWLHWLKQQEFVGTLQNVERNLTTLNSTTLVSSKREGTNIASLLTLQSLQPSVQGVWETVSATFVWLLIPTSVSQRCFRKTKGTWKDTFLSVKTAPTHVKTRDAVHLCSAAVCSQFWFIQLMQKGWGLFPTQTNRIDWSNNLHRFPQVFVGQTNPRIPKLSNFEFWAKLCTWNCPIWRFRWKLL